MSEIIPNGWQECTILSFLGQGSLFSDGDWVESKDQDEEGENRLIQLADIGDGAFLHKSSRFLNNAQFTKLRCTELIEGDILIARMPEPLGRACLFPKITQRCATVVDVAILRNPSVNRSWLMYAINSANVKKQIESLSAGTTRTRISRGLFGGLRIRTPCRPDQNRIAEILETLDQAIEKTEALIEKYHLIKAGLMHNLFTRGITADGKLRPSREQAPELYQETAIGWIPKEWELTELKSKARPGMAHLRTGPFGSALKGEHWTEDGTPVITIGALGEGAFIKSELLYVGEVDANRLSSFRLEIGDVVFSRVADVGRSVVIEKEQLGWIMSSNLMRITLDNEEVVPKFLQYQLASDSRIKKQIRCKVNSGGRDVANSDILNRLQFVFPDYSEQLRFIQRSEILISLIRKEQSKVKKLKKQKSGLMHDLLTGKVPVTPDEKANHV